MDEVDDGENIFSLSAGDSLAVGEQFTPLIFDVISELCIYSTTAEKGE